MIIPAPDQGHGTSLPSSQPHGLDDFQIEAEFANYAVARMLPREALHAPKIADKVWMAFMRRRIRCRCVPGHEGGQSGST